MVFSFNMKFIFACFVLAAPFSVTVAAPRIVGGQTTTIERYPGVVQLEVFSGYSWYLTCGANIINTRYLLTAASCIYGSSVNYHRIRAGATTRGSGGSIYSLLQILKHPTYDQNNYDGDISLLQTSTSLVFGSGVQPVGFATRVFELGDGLPVVQVGWGSTMIGGSSSSVLRDVTVQTINWETCRSRYTNYNVTENMICTGILNVGGKDACQGDGGGPVYYNNVLVGIISWGIGCADENYPGVNTKVGAFTDWILANAS